jgi:hypothetical protein
MQGSRIHLMDLAKLRLILRSPIVALSQMNRHVDLPELCERLGMLFPDQDISERARLIVFAPSTASVR